MKKYRIEIINKRDGCVVYKHSTNNFETLKNAFQNIARNVKLILFTTMKHIQKYT